MQNELKNRRQFFKEATQKALPILGLTVMAFTAPCLLQSCKKDSVNGCDGCAGSCQDSCSGSCSSSCTGKCTSCKNGCTGTCLGCTGTCSHDGCKNTCMSCSGNCAYKCKGVSK